MCLTPGGNLTKVAVSKVRLGDWIGAGSLFSGFSGSSVLGFVGISS